MKSRKLTLLAILAASLLSCKEDELTIQGQVKVFNFFISEDTQEPIADLPVSILLSPHTLENTPIAQQKTIFNCKTDKDGFYHFNIKESDFPELFRYNAYLIKSSPFDSTKVEWQYMTDSTFYKITNFPGQLFFSQANGHSLNPRHGFKLFPAGWVTFKLVNNTHTSYRISNGLNFTTYINASEDTGYPFLLLSPGKIHEITVKDHHTEETITLGTLNLFVRNSFVRTSRPWNEDLKSDTVVLDVCTMKYMVIKADL